MENENLNTTKKEKNNPDKTIDIDAKNKRTKSIVKLSMILLILVAIIALIVWSCSPKYVSIPVASATVDSNSQVLELKPSTNDNFSYKVNLKNYDNVEAYYLGIGSDGLAHEKQLQVITPTMNGPVIEFKLTLYFDDESELKGCYINGQRVENFGGHSGWFFKVQANARPVKKEVDILYIILNLLPSLIWILIIAWYLSRLSRMSAMGMMGQGEESIFGIGRSQAKIVRSSVKFSDVAGIEEEKNELIEIVDYLKNPEKYAAMGARTPRGVLLYGPPGTGKTLLAKAVAGEAKVPFFQVSGSGFEDMLVGVGAKRVRDLFNRAKKAAPSIIFIDEIDSVASKRGRADIIGGGGGIADQTINQLLAEMDGFNTKTGVVIMAATNRLEALDEAILRPGRFDRHIQVNLPDIKEREAILKIHARNKNLSTKVELADIARRTPGFSGAQLENVLNEATLLTVRRNKTAITMDEIDEAIDRVIAGPAKHTRIITDKERKQIAYHEAGHALVGLHSKGGDVIEKITIIPRGVAAGYTISTPAKQELSIQRKTDLLAIVRTTLGGRAAEFVEYGPQAISTGAANDLYKVSTIVRSMVTQLGMSEVGMTQLVPSVGMKNSFAQKLYSEDTAVKIDHEVEKIIQQEYQKAIDIVTKNKKELELIVETLLLLETIVKKQIDYIHKKLKLPQEALDKKRSLSSRKKPNRSKDV